MVHSSMLYLKLFDYDCSTTSHNKNIILYININCYSSYPNCKPKHYKCVSSVCFLSDTIRLDTVSCKFIDNNTNTV